MNTGDSDLATKDYRSGSLVGCFACMLFVGVRGCGPKMAMACSNLCDAGVQSTRLQNHPIFIPEVFR